MNESTRPNEYVRNLVNMTEKLTTTNIKKLNMIKFYIYIYSRLSRSFTARGVTSRDPPKGIRLISF